MAMLDEPQRQTRSGVRPPVRPGTPPKSKAVAVTLAVVLAFWTWLYTYRADAGKFWAGLILTGAGIGLLFAWVGLPILLAVWVWAVFDTASKDRSWYTSFPR